MTAVELETLRNAALTLSKQDRASLARDLMASLDGPAEDSVAEAWDRELCRRVQRIESGEAELLDPQEVLFRARARIGGCDHYASKSQRGSCHRIRRTKSPIVPVSYRAAAAGARQLILHRFPFSLITIEKGRTIIAVVDFPRSIGRMSSKLAYLEY